MMTRDKVIDVLTGLRLRHQQDETIRALHALMIHDAAQRETIAGMKQEAETVAAEALRQFTEKDQIIDQQREIIDSVAVELSQLQTLMYHQAAEIERLTAQVQALRGALEEIARKAIPPGWFVDSEEFDFVDSMRGRASRALRHSQIREGHTTGGEP